MDTLLNVLMYAIPGLGFLVLIHELGHLLFARLGGIGVEAFSIFFGRAIYKFKWKGIEWRVGWIPFGGYCKMKGQEDFGEAESKGEPDEFYERPAWSRLMAILAGPVFNIILGLLLFIFITFSVGETVLPNSGVVVSSNYKGKIGLKDGDVIVKVDKKEVKSWNDVKEHLIDGIHQKTQYLTVNRDGKIIEIPYQFDKNKRIKNQMGFSLPQYIVVNSVSDKIVDADKKIVRKKSPAREAGLRGGDIILSLDDKIIRNNDDLFHLMNQEKTDRERKFTVLSQAYKTKKDGKGREIASLEEVMVAIDKKKITKVAELNDIVNQQNKKTLVLTFLNLKTNKETQRTVEKKDIFIKPVQVMAKNYVTGKVEKRWQVGFAPIPLDYPGIIAGKFDREYGFLESVPRGLEKGWSFMALALNQFKLLAQLSSDSVLENVAGPVGIMKHISDVGSRGFTELLNFLAFLSILLGVFNLLPIPAVDGGHVLLTLYEMIRRKRLSLKVIQRIQIVGVFIILTLAVLVTANDIKNLFF